MPLCTHAVNMFTYLSHKFHFSSFSITTENAIFKVRVFFFIIFDY